MDGKYVYDLYCEKDLELNFCGNDPWETLEPSVQAVWHAVAKALDNQ